ncbi:dihydroorotase [Camelimonas abortus]|uniref:Dihydroorotase n=1 Tax=Camelimonas abortus TaxID=1017184 RepID=A0ABV7LF09_9HYPH
MTEQAHTRALINAGLIDPATGRRSRGAVLIRGGRIAGVLDEARPATPEGAEVVDCGGALVAPGVIDMRAFLGEPGAEYRETLKTASRAAAAGGVTTLVSAPETSPPVDSPATVDFIRRRARDNAVVRVAPAAALTRGLEGRELAEYGLLLEAGAVAFTDGARSVASPRVMRMALAYARNFDALVMHHTEDADLTGDGVATEGELASRMGLPSAPREAETIMLERDLRLVRMTGGRYHAAMITHAQSVELIRQAKDEGLPVTCGVSINHLALNENDIAGYRTFFKLRPPLRAEEDRLALLEALEEGVIDVIVSDHNPQDVEAKRLPFPEAAPGAIGLETLLPVAVRLASSGAASLQRILDALTARPAGLLGFDRGRLVPGLAADLVVIDTEAAWIYRRDAIRSRCKNTPFDGGRMEGMVLRTIVNGQDVFVAAGETAA